MRWIHFTPRTELREIYCKINLKMGIENRFQYWLMIDGSCEDCLSSHLNNSGWNDTSHSHPQPELGPCWRMDWERFLWLCSLIRNVGLGHSLRRAEILKYQIYGNSLNKAEARTRVQSQSDLWLSFLLPAGQRRRTGGLIFVNISSISYLKYFTDGYRNILVITLQICSAELTGLA